MPTPTNRRLAVQLALVAVLFAGFGFGMVPLYDVLCRITGLNGRTNTMAAPRPANTQVDESRWVKVEFLSHTMPGVSLDLKPEQFSMRVHPGAVIQTSYVVRNTTAQPFVGQAVPSITPAVAATHFRKIECFCFNQQTLDASEVRTMPLVFVVDEALDPDIRTITLSYTFFEAPKARI
jgi:cytochrome c oxidase assembly protein subunit 11